MPVAPVLSVVEAMHHPHLRERRTVRTVTDRIAGELQIPGSSQVSGFPQLLELERRYSASQSGNLQHYLGYSEEQVKDLKSTGPTSENV